MMKSLFSGELSKVFSIGLASIGLAGFVTLVGAKTFADDECGSQAVGVITGAVSSYEENVTQMGCGAQNDPAKYFSQSTEAGAIFSSPATAETGADSSGAGTIGAGASDGTNSGTSEKHSDDGSATK